MGHGPILESATVSGARSRARGTERGRPASVGSSAAATGARRKLKRRGWWPLISFRLAWASSRPLEARPSHAGGQGGPRAPCAAVPGEAAPEPRAGGEGLNW